MTGTRKGGKKAAKTRVARYGKNIHRIWGKKGGNPAITPKRKVENES